MSWLKKLFGSRGEKGFKSSSTIRFRSSRHGNFLNRERSEQESEGGKRGDFMIFEITSNFMSRIGIFCWFRWYKLLTQAFPFLPLKTQSLVLNFYQQKKNRLLNWVKNNNNDNNNKNDASHMTTILHHRQRVWGRVSEREREVIITRAYIMVSVKYQCEFAFEKGHLWFSIILLLRRRRRPIFLLFFPLPPSLLCPFHFQHKFMYNIILPRCFYKPGMWNNLPVIVRTQGEFFVISSLQHHQQPRRTHHHRIIIIKQNGKEKKIRHWICVWDMRIVTMIKYSSSRLYIST